jgi:hypothetical protein
MLLLLISIQYQCKLWKKINITFFLFERNTMNSSDDVTTINIDTIPV